MTPNLTTILILILVIVIAVVAIGLFLWWRAKQKAKADNKAPEPAGDQSDAQALPGQIRSLFKTAQQILKTSPKMKGVHISSLPAFLVIGPSRAGRTSVVERSGLERKLLAGQVYMGSDTVPTAALNIWLARQALFVEIAEPLAHSEEALGAILKELIPGGLASASGKFLPSRCILFCADHAAVSLAKVPDDIVAYARPWNECLERISSILGAQVPVYALLTHLDSVTGFAEFVSDIHAREAAFQPALASGCIGATFRPFHAATDGLYSEYMSPVLNREMVGITAALRDSRVPLLNRQQDKTKLLTAYQFPGEFQKLNKNLVKFLFELAKPSELHASPFLRGFYFSGTRRVAADPTENLDPQRAAHAADAGSLTATSFLNPQQLKAAHTLASTPQSPKEIMEWPFLPAFFSGVLLSDHSAHRVTSVSSRTDKMRALALGFAALLGVFLLVALTVSYVRNRSLEKSLIAGAAALAPAPSPALLVPALDKLRQPTSLLLQYRGGVDTSMTWGLFTGHKLLPFAQAEYCSAVRSQLLPPVLDKLVTRLRLVRTSGGDHTGDFGYLKAYMMLTTHPAKADDAFLSQQLLDVWSDAAGNVPAGAEAEKLLDQFRTFGALLSVPDNQSYCVSAPVAEVIPTAQQALRELNATDHYRSLLQQAGKGLEPVSYTKMFPNDAVSDALPVPGWFTRQGWDRMQQLLAKPEESLKADAWVLGGAKDLSIEELRTLASDYSKRYTVDFVAIWKKYLAAARVTPYTDLKDAAAKLEKISGEHSFLLNLIALASEHAGRVDKLKPIFQPVKTSVPAVGEFQPGAEYLKQLDALKNRLAKAAGSTGAAHDQDVQEVRSAATAARDAVDQIARMPGFRGDGESDQAVKTILLMPLTQIDPLLSKQNAEAVNGAAGDLCKAYGQLTRQLPFSANAQQSASLEDVQRVFQPEKGLMWQFYNDALRESLDCQGADCSAKSNPKFNLSSGFIEFFRGLNRWSRLLYGGTQDPIVRLQIRASTINHLKQMELVVDDQRLTLPAGANEYQNFSWDLRKAQKLQGFGTFDGEPKVQDLFRIDGRWALFQWFFDVKKGSGGADGFTWLPRQGEKMAAVMDNGNTKEYKLEIRMGDGSGRPLDLRSLGNGSCVAPVAH
jgi:type VI secretion system protein ImpL